MEDLLRIENVSKHFAGHTALDNVSLSIPQGSIYGLLGPNGAGKTTLIRIINRITAPDSGRVFFEGHEIAPEDIYHIGYLPEERGLYKKMKVGEQAIFFARLKGLSRHEATVRLKEWFIKFGIQDWWNKKVEELSKGMAQKVQFISTVVHEPKLLIFDEPFSGFDPINADRLKQEILGLRDRGATVIFSTHNMASVEEICDHITLINKSHNVLSGSVEEIRREAGGNTFEVIHRADDEQFNLAIAGIATPLTESRGIVGGYRETKIHIAKDEDVKVVIERLNNKCDLRAISEVIPSINDIFIRAVNGAL